MNDREKLANLNTMLDTLIDTCKSEIKISEKIMIETNNGKEFHKQLKEQIFWEGKLEVAEYVKLFIK